MKFDKRKDRGEDVWTFFDRVVGKNDDYKGPCSLEKLGWLEEISRYTVRQSSLRKKIQDNLAISEITPSFTHSLFPT